MATACVDNDEFWRVCANWLTQLELLRADHRANWSEALIVDLASTLRDGVLLCNLLNKLEPGCIDPKDFSQKPALAQFLCLRNITLFLTTCKNNFGLSDDELFEPSMLFDLTNFHSVLCTLSALSLTHKSLKSKVPGFSVKDEKTEEEEAIYLRLKSVKPPPAMYDNVDYYASLTASGEEIYQDLCSIRQDLVGSQPLEKRDYVIKELMDTESNYVDVLSKIQKYYINPLVKYMNPDDHNTIFNYINDLLTIHLDFRNQLIDIQVDKTKKLSAIFMGMRERFLIYGSFCSNLMDATNLLQDLCDNSEILCMAVAKSDKEANSGKFKLRDLLQVPMQRILKYHLLLEKLVESTDPNHEEYKELKRAREAMVDVANYINEMARDKDHLNVLKEVRKNMVWDGNDFPIETCGRLRKDGEIKVKEHSEKATKSRYVFIFDKYMFLTKQTRPNQFMFRGKLDLADFTIEDHNNRALMNQGPRWAYQWHMFNSRRSVVYTMSVKSIENKEMMIKAIKDAIDNIRPSSLSLTNHQFTMYNFENPVSCNRCSKYLKGLIYQGYKCGVCGIAVHKECICTSGRCGIPLPIRPSSSSTEPLGLQSKLWFAGEKDRAEAAGILEKRKPGTFLVRIRMLNNPEKYALSLKTMIGVKHMKILCNMEGTQPKYHLSISRFFGSVEEMVANYQHVSLKENFERLEEYDKLEYPYRQIKCMATQSYHPAEPGRLWFDEKETVIIIDKEETDGWSKGLARRGMGYFPTKYVCEQEEILYDFTFD
ncbi:PREDICTED: protein vav isoform X2 [Nicrophorus vespilloides]|uniref:Protein vav isoform X2 n=1 Tax=Nicrophorus vespilloides TaxID=110193 RepID=A0ABM1MYF4_NICVS|nr:PREDICTED: protein vav isoform X2 [Nicrophorus vespilloides]